MIKDEIGVCRKARGRWRGDFERARGRASRLQVGMQAGMRQGIFVLDGHAGGRVRGHSCFGWACRKAFRRASVFRMGKQEGMCFAVPNDELITDATLP